MVRTAEDARLFGHLLATQIQSLQRAEVCFQQDQTRAQHFVLDLRWNEVRRTFKSHR